MVSNTPQPYFTPGERPGTHCTGGWVGPRASLDGRKISAHRDSISGPTSPAHTFTKLQFPLSQGSIIDNRISNYFRYITRVDIAGQGQSHFECSVTFMYNMLKKEAHMTWHLQGGSNMTGTDLCVNKCKKSRSFLNHPVYSN